MCRSMIDIQSATAEIRQGKRRKKEETTRQKYNGLSYPNVKWKLRHFRDAKIYIKRKMAQKRRRNDKSG